LQNTEGAVVAVGAADVLWLLLLFGSYYISWSFLVFPLWVLLSVYILRDSIRRPSGHPAKGSA
jgi:uncharacterized membrane protein YbhN (UPF0104 family)